MKTIIVPIDFSTESLTGLNFAIMLTNKTCAKIQLVHVIEKTESMSKEQLEKEKGLAKGQFEDLLHRYASKSNMKLNVNYTVKDGKVFKEVTELAESLEDPLIVLSTNGASGFEELFIGGNAYKITSHSKVPVITVRRKSIPSNIERIVLPLDITYQTREKVPYTVKLAKLFHSEIHLVTISLSKFINLDKKLHQYADQVRTYLGNENIPIKTIHLEGNNLTDITIEYACSINADLISIMTEQEESISNILLGSYAHQMINKAYIPVLSFPTYQLSFSTEGFRTTGQFSG
jgi:nucleotide-binding universal stress UspA family protein